MGLFDDHAKANEARARELVEQCIVKLGVDPQKSVISGTAPARRYALRRGSASILIALAPPSAEIADGSLRVVAPVVKVSAQGDNSALYAWLLAANANELCGAAFGLADGKVVVVAERGLTDLDASEVDGMIRTVGTVADHYDDVLSEQFGIPRASDSP